MTSLPSAPGARSGAITAAAYAIVAALTIYLLVVGEAILMPLVLAIFITYLIAALGQRIHRIKIGGWSPPDWLGLVGAILIFLLVIGVMVQLAAGNISDVVKEAPVYQERLQAFFTQGMNLAARLLKLEEPPTLTALVREIDLRALVERIADAFQGIAASTFQVFAYVAFMLLELRIFDRKLKALTSDPEQERNLRAALTAIGDKVETYVLLKTGISLLNGVLSYIILRLFGVDFAGFWALLVFVLNFIPYIGSPIAMTFPTVLALLQFGSLVTASLVLGSLIAVQAFVENVIEPQITGKTLNLSPVMMILSLSVWGAIWGITGMILSVPSMVIAMIVLAQFAKTKPIAVVMSASGDVD
jgi:AI-2 transport protein TqsA